MEIKHWLQLKFQNQTVTFRFFFFFFFPVGTVLLHFFFSSFNLIISKPNCKYWSLLITAFFTSDCITPFVAFDFWLLFFCTNRNLLHIFTFAFDFWFLNFIRNWYRSFFLRLWVSVIASVFLVYILNLISLMISPKNPCNYLNLKFVSRSICNHWCNLPTSCKYLLLLLISYPSFIWKKYSNLMLVTSI